MKITKEHVGKRVRRSLWDADFYVRVLALGEKWFIADHPTLGENTYLVEDLSTPWELLHDPKPQAAPAFYCSNERWGLSFNLYSSEEEAKLYLGPTGRWPAIPDPKTGMYTLPED